MSLTKIQRTMSNLETRMRGALRNDVRQLVELTYQAMREENSSTPWYSLLTNAAIAYQGMGAGEAEEFVVNTILDTYLSYKDENVTGFSEDTMAYFGISNTASAIITDKYD